MDTGGGPVWQGLGRVAMTGVDLLLLAGPVAGGLLLQRLRQGSGQG